MTNEISIQEVKDSILSMFDVKRVGKDYEIINPFCLSDGKGLKIILCAVHFSISIFNRPKKEYVAYIISDRSESFNRYGDELDKYTVGDDVFGLTRDDTSQELYSEVVYNKKNFGKELFNFIDSLYKLDNAINNNKGL